MAPGTKKPVFKLLKGFKIHIRMYIKTAKLWTYNFSPFFVFCFLAVFNAYLRLGYVK